MAYLPEALADAMSESCSKICSILETDATMKGAKAKVVDAITIGAPFPVDHTSATEYVLLPIHRRISSQRAETRRTSQACP